MPSPETNPTFSTTSLSDWSEPLSVPRPGGEIWTWDNWWNELTDTEREYLLPAMERSVPAAVSQLRHTGPCYVVGFLSAPRAYVDGPEGPEQQHFHSSLGTALTNDFRNFSILSYTALSALPDEGSIWSGSFVRGGSCERAGRPLFYFFYTRRDLASEDPLAQQVAAASTCDFLSFERSTVLVTPDNRWYETASIPGDTSIHSFRDPFPFRMGDRAYMLLSAKSRFLPAGKLGVQCGENAVIAVYRGTAEERLDSWEATSLCFSTGTSEAEVASIYFDLKAQSHRILFSCKSRASYLSRAADRYGKAISQGQEHGELYSFLVPNLQHLLDSPPETPVRVAPELISVSRTDGYAYRINPQGNLLGFSATTGRPCLAAVPPQLGNLTGLSQDFSGFRELR